MKRRAPAATPVRPALLERLITACCTGKVNEVQAAIADGAAIDGDSDDPLAPGPLVAAVFQGHYNVVRLLLSHGADPNGHLVAQNACESATPGILQLLIDAGCAVNGSGAPAPPLHLAVDSVFGGIPERVRLLLSQPLLDIAARHGGETAEAWARSRKRFKVADMIAAEVSGPSLLLPRDRRQQWT